MEAMKEDKPVSSLEAQRAPALAPEEGLSTPVSAPRNAAGKCQVDISRRDQMSCLVLPCTRVITNLLHQFTGLKQSTVARLHIDSLPFLCNLLTALYFKMKIKNKNKNKNLRVLVHTPHPPAGPGSFCLFAG